MKAREDLHGPFILSPSALHSPHTLSKSPSSQLQWKGTVMMTSTKWQSVLPALRQTIIYSSVLLLAHMYGTNLPIFRILPIFSSFVLLE